MEGRAVSDAITEIFDVLRASNKYIDETTPWILAKDEEKRDRLESVLYHLLESIRVCAVFLEPFFPETSKEILRQLNTEDKSFGYGAVSVYQLNEPQVLFARIDKEKMSKDM